MDHSPRQNFNGQFARCRPKTENERRIHGHRQRGTRDRYQRRGKRRRLSPPSSPPPLSPESPDIVVVSDHDNGRKQPINRRTQSRQREDEVISIQNESFVIEKRLPEQPVFYDPQTAIARECNAIQCLFDDAPFEEDEKRRLIVHEKLNAISKWRREHERAVDDLGNPLSPPGSDDSDAEEEDSNEVNWGATRDRNRCSIFDDTKEVALMDNDGVNVLQNERWRLDEEMKDKYWIYHQRGYPIQCTKPPPDCYIDGEFLVANAKVVSKRRRNRKYRGKHSQRKKSHQLYDRGSGECQPVNFSSFRQNNGGNARYDDQAVQLAAYLDAVRMQKI